MRDLIILGTGVHAAEMAHIVERINCQKPVWNLLGHVTPKSPDLKEWGGHPVIGSTAALEEVLAAHPEAALVVDNEFPKSLPLPEERLVSLIDPSCYVHPLARIGRGCVLYPQCFVGLKAALGERVFMLAGSIINHDDVLEDRVVVASGVTLAGYVHVETGVYLGQSCTVRQSLRIGSQSVIGMGAVVVKNVESKSVMVGNPARLLRKKG